MEGDGREGRRGEGAPAAPPRGQVCFPHREWNPSQVCYRGRDVLLVGTDTGDGSMTDSGYPRTVLEWKRGTPLSAAKLVYEGQKEDVAASGYAYLDRGESYEWRQRAITFWTSEHEIKMPDGSFAKVPVQDDAQLGPTSPDLA